MHGNDDGMAGDEGKKPELLLAVVGLDFPDVVGDFLKEFLGHHRIGILLKEPDPHRDGLRAVIIQLIQPFGDRLFAVGGPVEFNEAVLFAALLQA